MREVEVVVGTEEEKVDVGLERSGVLALIVPINKRKMGSVYLII